MGARSRKSTGIARWHHLARRVQLVSALAGIALVAAACGSSTPSTGATTSSPTSTSSASTAAVIIVKTANVAGETALVDAKGFTLYIYALDKPGKIACLAACLVSWPPLLVPSGEHLSMSMPALGTETRPGGDVQVTYKGSPLYTFAGDTKPGEDHGAGIPDWSVARISSSASGWGAATSTTSSSGGDGY